MSVAKFKIVMRLEKLSKSTNEAPICIRITKDRKSMYKTLFHIDPKYWDAKEQRVKKQHPNSELLNAKITKSKAECEQESYLLSLANDSVGLSTIRNKINNRTSQDLFEYAGKYLEQLEKDGKYATYKKNKSVVKKLRDYLQKDVLPIKSITPEFIKQYENYLLNTLRNNRNTVTVNMKALAKLVRDIFREYNLDETNNPFKNIKFKREQTDKVFLEIDEIKKIQELKLTPINPLCDTKDMFLFECFTGIRIADILTLKWKNVSDKTITIIMRKTAKPLTINQSNDVLSIIGKRRARKIKHEGEINPEAYVFNVLKVDIDRVSAQEALNAISSATAIINKQLKRIAKKTGINKNLSTHVARHMKYSNKLYFSALQSQICR